MLTRKCDLFPSCFFSFILNRNSLRHADPDYGILDLIYISYIIIAPVFLRDDMCSVGRRRPTVAGEKGTSQMLYHVEIYR